MFQVTKTKKTVPISKIQKFNFPKKSQKRKMIQLHHIGGFITFEQCMVASVVFRSAKKKKKKKKNMDFCITRDSKKLWFFFTFVFV